MLLSTSSLDAANRLQAAVEHLLEIVATAMRQLAEVQASQRELVVAMETTQAEAKQLEASNAELEQRMREETEARQYLALELNKAEGERGTTWKKNILNFFGIEKKFSQCHVFLIELIIRFLSVMYFTS